MIKGEDDLAYLDSEIDIRGGPGLQGAIIQEKAKQLQILVIGLSARLASIELVPV
eukprot:CAMPEP_0170474724 /NCGR_PEP_ID=MMETSP0123-20130129/16458_1 /TAXON_ID=182087 /ORGANISM="Favella ehrenbergii, Strain Fehren 1" /LENGTH=54 /DNA_ID=CAMNT_0010744687 /DNA_START=153 /DNA_END=317 /DNA_ORIENTATION=-